MCNYPDDYTTTNPQKLSCTWVYEDKNNKIWIATRGSGVFKISNSNTGSGIVSEAHFDKT